jgi:hypothetical protein
VTTQDATALLTKARDLVGPTYKRRVWRAWFNGNYAEEGLETLSQELQQLRNSLGPKFLDRAKLPKKVDQTRKSETGQVY